MATVFDVASYFISLNNMKSDFVPDEECGDDPITHMKLQKLVYYAQGASLAILDKPLFDDRIEAWKYGPVSPQLYHQYKHYKNDLTHKKNVCIENIAKKFSEAELNVLNFVYYKF